MKARVLILLTLIMGVAVGSADAQIRNRHENARIGHGIRKGELTRAEAYHLKKQQHRIHRHERKARFNDGRISPRERKMLAYEKRKAGKKIYRYKHNRYNRF
ncbi:MAG: hypothetical protein H7Y31_00955 [Chitinophagaceae bacterium]|nr:hypothetical protein [Chitinophagaceae bacterium]